MDSERCLSTPVSLTNKDYKRHLRVLKNRLKAKDHRLRTKAKTKLLETQVKQLSEQISQLRRTAESAKEVGLEEAGEELRQELSRVVGTGAGEEGIEGLLREATEKFGPRGSVRVDWLRSAFQRTVALLVPESVLLSLALSDDRMLEMQSLLQASLSTQQYELFITMQRESSVQRLALAKALDSFKDGAAAIWCHASRLHSMLHSEVRPLFEPKQLGRFVLWIHRHYAKLKAEEVLDYGHNSTEVLNA